MMGLEESVFTGIVERAGEVTAVNVAPGAARLTVAAGPIARETSPGHSVAVNGCCLTVVEVDGDRLSFDAVPQTLSLTNLGDLRPGSLVNLERPLRFGDRLDGHLVQGHVDGVGVLRSVTPEGTARRLRVEAPEETLRHAVLRGSIAVDGISLTIAGLDRNWFEVAVIPHTWEVTNLHARAPGERVNLELDILAKYVERLLAR
jgi:riboflavin synthase